MEEMSADPESQIYQQVSSELFKLIRSTVSTQLCLILLIVLAYFEIPIEYSVIPFICLSVYQLVLQCFILAGSSFMYDLNTSFEGYYFFQKLFDGLGELLAIIQLRSGEYPLWYLTLSVFTFIANHYYKEKDYHQMQAYFHVVQMILRLCIFASGSILLYDASMTPSIEWADDLSPITYYFLLFALCHVVYIFYIIGYRTLNYDPAEIPLDLVGIYINCVFCVSSLLVAYNLSSLAKFFKDLNPNVLIFPVTLLGLSWTAMIIVTCILKEKVIFWCLVTFEYFDEDYPVRTTHTEYIETPMIFLRSSNDFYKPISLSEYEELVYNEYNDSSQLEEEEITDDQPEECKEAIHSHSADVCSICFDNLPEIVLLPCGHGNICMPCFRMLVFKKTCHICRNIIVKAAKIKQNSRFAVVAS